MIQTSKHLCYNTSGPSRGRFYFQGVVMDTRKRKPWLSFETQCQVLKDRGLDISDNKFMENFLSTYNYYYITGYLHSYKDTDGKYRKGTCIEEISQAIKADREFHMLFFYVIESIERKLKSVMAYYIGKNHSDDDLGYLIYDQKYVSANEKVNKFLPYFRKAVKNNSSLPFVNHYINKYGGVFPIWVAVEVFTLGNLENLYSILDKKTSREIADEFSIKRAVLVQWIKCLRVFRNTLAHNGRLHNFTFRLHPKQFECWEIEQTNMVFDYIYMCKFLFPEKNEWEKVLVGSLKSVFIENHVKLSSYGFPHNWKELLMY